MKIPPCTTKRLCGTSVVRPGRVHEISGFGVPAATQFNVTGNPRLTRVTEASVLVMLGGKTITDTGYGITVEPKEFEALQVYVPLSKVATCLTRSVPFASRDTRPMFWILSRTTPLGKVHLIDACGQPSTVQGRLRFWP